MTGSARSPSPGGSEQDPAGEPSFEDAVSAVLRATRAGEVLTYGEVAAEAGRPGAARVVGRILSQGTGDLPWWRVVTASGRLVPGHEAEHTRRLEAEGVDVDRSRGRVRPTAAGGGRPRHR